MLHKRLIESDGALSHEMLLAFAEALMSSEVEALCGARTNDKTEPRANQRSGCRTRNWDTRVGSIDLQLPKLRRG